MIMSTTARKPPMLSTGPWAWAQQNLFGSIWNTLTTVVIVVVLALIVPPLVEWAFTEAVWMADNNKPNSDPHIHHQYGMKRDSIHLLF